MNSTLATIIISFTVLPLLVLSYQLGTPQALGQSGVGDYLSQPALTALVSAKKQEPENMLPYRNAEVEDLILDSTAALAWDFGQNVILFSKNADVTHPIASLTKLISAAVVLDYSQPQETAAISLRAIRTEGNSGNLREGEILTVYDLLAALLLESSNDAAYALAEYTGHKIISNQEPPADPVKAFVKAMNQKFNDLGLVHTNLTDPSGLEDRTSFSTAEDLSRFIKYMRHNPNYLAVWEILKMTSYRAESQNSIAAHEFKNTNPFLAEFEGVIGGKTGYTPIALGNMSLVIAGPNNTEIVYLVLGSTDRFGDTRKMIDWVGRAWIWPIVK